MDNPKTNLEREFANFEAVCNKLSDELAGHGLSKGKADNFRQIRTSIEIAHEAKSASDLSSTVKIIISTYEGNRSFLEKNSSDIKRLVNQLHHTVRSEKTIVSNMLEYSKFEKQKAKELKISRLIRRIKRQHTHLLATILDLNDLIIEIGNHTQEISEKGNILDNEEEIAEGFAQEIESIGKKGYKALKKIYYYHKIAEDRLKELSKGEGIKIKI